MKREWYTFPGGQSMKAVFKTVWPYQQDELNLPVADVEAALPFYETIMGFRLLARNDAPHASAVLSRDGIQIGLAENGGDPSQDGCFFEVDNAEAAFAELKSNGLEREDAGFRIDQYGDTAYKVFFVVAPDGLCYCLGERQN
jgi:catechol 2,3-dioxygenase-like lactoylglutathione lyase family enzyme